MDTSTGDVTITNLHWETKPGVRGSSHLKLTATVNGKDKAVLFDLGNGPYGSFDFADVSANLDLNGIDPGHDRIGLRLTADFTGGGVDVHRVDVRAGS
ncbi:MAG: hypothetical protein ACE5H3_04455 [Planctomycetota bacterium]